MELNPINWGIQQISSGLKSVTIDPIKDIICYAVPWIKATFERHVFVMEANRPLVKFMGGDEVVDSLQKEFKELASAAEINNEEIYLYTSLGARFSGFRSLTGNVVTFPIEHIAHKNLSYVNIHETLLTDQQLENEKWVFSENETRFLLGLSVAELAILPFLKVAARVAILVLLIGLFFTPLNVFSGGTVFFIGVFLYYTIERIIGNRIDLCAQKMLKQRFINAGMKPKDAHNQAAIVAINTLKKKQLQQLEMRDQGPIYRFFITANGDERFNRTIPPVKKRIARLEALIPAQTPAQTAPKVPNQPAPQKNRQVLARSHRSVRRLSDVPIGSLRHGEGAVLQNTCKRKKLHTAGQLR